MNVFLWALCLAVITIALFIVALAHANNLRVCPGVHDMMPGEECPLGCGKTGSEEEY